MPWTPGLVVCHPGVWIRDEKGCRVKAKNIEQFPFSEYQKECRWRRWRRVLPSLLLDLSRTCKSIQRKVNQESLRPRVPLTAQTWADTVQANRS